MSFFCRTGLIWLVFVDLGGKNESVRVAVRIRPLIQREIDEGQRDVVTANKATKSLGIAEGSRDITVTLHLGVHHLLRAIVAQSADKPKTFTYDAVFDPGMTLLWLLRLHSYFC